MLLPRLSFSNDESLADTYLVLLNDKDLIFTLSILLFLVCIKVTIKYEEPSSQPLAKKSNFGLISLAASYGVS